MQATRHAERARGKLVSLALSLVMGLGGSACGGEMVRDLGKPADSEPGTGGRGAAVDLDATTDDPSGAGGVSSGTGGVSSSAGGVSTGGVASVAGAAAIADPESCASPSAVSASVLWRGLGYNGYAFKPGYFGFSPDGHVLESPGRAQTQYDVATGSLLGTAELAVTARDRAWERELVGGQILEVQSRSVLLDAVGPVLSQQVGTFASVALSGDGRYVFWLDGECGKDTISVHRSRVDGDERETRSLIGFCDGGWQRALAVTANGSAALVSSGSTRLWHVDFAGGALSTRSIHQSAAGARTGMSITLSPDDRFVAIVGSDDLLRTFTYPTFEPILAGVPVAWSNAFAWCYCVDYHLAPVAWSADASLLASADESGHAVIRRACDGQILATLDPLAAMNLPLPARPSDLGPMFLAFAPSGAGLAVGFERSLAYFGFNASE